MGQNEGETDVHRKHLSLMTRDFARRQISGEIITKQQEKRERESPASFRSQE